MASAKHAIIVHGGAGSAMTVAESCRAAAESGIALLRAGSGALEAAVAAVAAMEDDGRFNAGSGSVLRLDGKTIEMDSAVMDSSGVLGAVASVAGVKNPVLLAREVAQTPHVLIAGAGASALAVRLGLAVHPGPSPRALQQHHRLLEALKSRPVSGPAGKESPKMWDETALERYWNFEVSPEFTSECDTVGATALDGNGVFAVATSTGGSSPMLRGRVGDTPLAGCGYYAGEHGAVAATGAGEEIIRRLGAFLVYQDLSRGASPLEACQYGVGLFPQTIPVGFIALGRHGYGMACNREMAWHAISE